MSRPSGLRRIRAVSRETAWLVALAFAIQSWLAVPVLLGMAASHFGAAAASIEVGHSHHDDGRAGPAPGKHHDHQRCPLCQTGLAKAITAAAAAVPLPSATPALANPAIPDDPAVAAPPLAYRSRAPPMAV